MLVRTRVQTDFSVATEHKLVDSFAYLPSGSSFAFYPFLG